MKVVTVIGARPQFIKAAAISRVISNSYADKIEEVILHTGQHHDENMSKIFFDELEIPKPKLNLEISGGRHGTMTGKMLGAIENFLIEEQPDWLLVYGDTNSTLAGALAAAKLHIPVAHVEAGLRSFNKKMPEEINRILVDKVSDLLFCPTEISMSNLKTEGIVKGVHNVGDVMFDIALLYREKALEKSKILRNLNLTKGKFCLATCHRAENTNDIKKLYEILTALNIINKNIQVVLPLHPRTRKLILEYNLSEMLTEITTTGPLSFFDMLAIEQSSQFILTDSGGVQKEAFFLNVPCITMRDETEWIETIESGLNTLTGASKERIVGAVDRITCKQSAQGLHQYPYGQGNSANLIVSRLLES